MKSIQYPLLVPNDLMAEIAAISKSINLSKADVMRQSMRLGLPRLRENLANENGRITNVEPLPKAVLRRIYRRRDDDEKVITRFMRAQAFDAE